MDNFASLMHGFGVALTTYHIALMMAGVLLGILVGVLPGLGAPNGVSLLLPLTFTMDPVAAIILLTSMYWGALFGGSTTSILFNIPGEPSSVATTFDGYPMAKQGRATQALTLAFLSAGFGALVGVILITILSFLPVFALTGMEGKMFHPLAWTKTFALIGVAILAITLVPALIPIFLRGRIKSEDESWLVRTMTEIFRPMLRGVSPCKYPR